MTDTTDAPALLHLGGDAYAHPALEPLLVPLDTLTLYPGNPRRADQDAITASIRDHGLYRPLVTQASSGRILAGNHTYRALQELEATHCPVTATHVDDAEAAAIVVRDNRTSELGGYNERDLYDLLQRIEADGAYSLDTIGYTTEDLAALSHAVKAHTYVDPDALPEEPDGEPVSQPGDLWILGEHRLAVGSAADPDVWERLLVDGEQGEAVWTDPPYGVDYKGGAKPRRAISGDAKPSDVVPAVFDHLLAATTSGACWYVTVPAGPSQAQFENWLNDRGVLRQCLIWVKNNATFGRTDYHYQHEPILYGRTPSEGNGRFGRLGSDGQGWWGDHSQTSVIEMARPASSEEHPTMKPVGLVEKCLHDGSPPGGIVLDPFGGSGTTLIACETTGRRCRMIELDLHYADTICRRFQTLTGVKPIRDGVPHDFTEAGP